MKKMTTDQIRQTWLDYFQSKDHVIVPSKSLIPVNDPSLLWINSGIATLKPYFSGIATPPANRLANSQRAIRTNDIENVGVTARHHTFFEMLGNFSIGDYFKKEAIEMAYELLTKYYGINHEALYITVYVDDSEALKVWLDLGIKKSHIVKGGKERNFWDIGQGPCGPCTEIYFDRGAKYDPKNEGVSLFINDIENDRYVEIWNIVFSQYNNDGKNNYTELTRKNIDTGAGLERLASISQEKHTDFDTDSFAPIIKKIEDLTNTKYDENVFFNKQSQQFLVNKDFKIIADHIKACTFAIADGAIPSGKDRGYVLRKLIRRAMVSAKRLNIDQNFLASVAESVIQTMSHSYPYLLKEKSNIVRVLGKEEALFLTTLSKGYELFENSLKNKMIDTETLFKLVDTYGFPFEIISELAEAKHVKLDVKSFNERFKRHQEISRSSADVKGMLSQNADLVSLNVKSEFEYEHLEIKNVKVVACFDENFKLIKELNGKGWLVFDKTVFYATSGGQLHDMGQIIINGKNYDVVDIVKAPGRQHLHLINANETIKNGDGAHLIVDQHNRLNSSRNHSVEHLIQHALQTVIDKNIKQEGAFKSAEKVSFDYHYHAKLSDQQIAQVQAKVNEYINAGFKVQTKIMSLDEAKKAGAIAYFEDTYSKLGKDLRVVCMGDVSMEICGGTHVNNTSDIEQFLILKIDNKGSGSWRLEGITSNGTISKYVKTAVDELKNKIQLIGTKTNDDKVSALIKQMKFDYSLSTLEQLKKQYVELDKVFSTVMYENQKANAVNELGKIKSMTKKLSLSKNIYYFVTQDIEPKVLSKALSEIINIDKEHAYIALNNYNGKLQYIILASQAFTTKTNFNAHQIIQQINKLSSGSGGGRNEFAQGGAINVHAVSSILDFIAKL